jgi:4-amino-4-deoxy-L-arabinose transferase-like glycosyltransferase
VAHTLTVMAVALLPMRQAVMSSVGNDSATECIFSLSLYTLLLIARRGVSRSRVVMLTLLLAAGLLTKASCVLLTPVAFAVLWLAAPERRLLARAVTGILPIVAAVAIAGPWFVRNARVYGEALPLRAFHAEFANTSRATDWIGKPLAVDPVTADLRPGPPMGGLGYAALVGAWTSRTFCAAYTPPSRQAVGAPAFLPVSVYAIYGLLTLIGLSASARAIGSALQQRRAWGLVLASQGAVAALVCASFIGFTATYFQAQGRYLYPALLPVSVLWGLGMARGIPARYTFVAVLLLSALLAALSLAFCFAYVARAY